MMEWLQREEMAVAYRGGCSPRHESKPTLGARGEVGQARHCIPSRHPHRQLVCMTRLTDTHMCA